MNIEIKQDFAAINNSRICYELWTPEQSNGEYIFAIMGLGAPLNVCPESLCKILCENGYSVIRYDNRDTGLSADTEYSCSINVAIAYIKLRLGKHFDAPYSLETMAADAAALIQYLNLGKVHLVGASMGGMIAQIVAANYPALIKTANLIMTSSNDPKLPLPKLKVLFNILGITGVKIIDAETAAQKQLSYWRTIKSPNYPSDEQQILEKARIIYRRCYRPNATPIHNLAILKTGDLSKQSCKINMPTIIIHGDADSMIHPKAAVALQRIIKNSRLEIIKGFSHEFPDSASPILAKLILENCVLAH